VGPFQDDAVPAPPPLPFCKCCPESQYVVDLGVPWSKKATDEDWERVRETLEYQDDYYRFYHGIKAPGAEEQNHFKFPEEKMTESPSQTICFQSFCDQLKSKIKINSGRLLLYSNVANLCIYFEFSAWTIYFLLLSLATADICWSKKVGESWQAVFRSLRRVYRKIKEEFSSVPQGSPAFHADAQRIFRSTDQNPLFDPG
jgi:hypothetical protein